MTPKFQIGDKVKFINDKDSEAGKVVAISQNEEENVYKITSSYYDFELSKVVDGFKTCKEDELVEVTEDDKE